VDSSVRLSESDRILLVQLESPDDFPRLTRNVLHQLSGLLDGVATRTELRGVVFTGTATAFAAGADLEEVSALTALEALRFSALGQGLMYRIERYRVQVVAAIRGYCLGGGFDLAMACHIRIAATDAVFGHPGGALGLVTGWGGTARLPRLLGNARALELLTTGQTISAEEAYAARLVNRLTSPDETISTAFEFLSHVSAG